MPKYKTHSSAKKRFRVTGGGKILHRRAARAHYLEHKPSTLTRRLADEAQLPKPEARRAKRLLGGSSGR